MSGGRPFWLPLLCLLAGSAAVLPAGAEERASPEAPAGQAAIGHRYAPSAFAFERLPHVGDLSRLQAELDLADGEPLAVRREAWNGDAAPELLVRFPERHCGRGGCSLALFDGATLREIGRFHGDLIVLDRRHGGYPVVRTLNPQGDGYYSLRTYVFLDATFQIEDDVLIGESERLRLYATLDIRR